MSLLLEILYAIQFFFINLFFQQLLRGKIVRPHHFVRVLLLKPLNTVPDCMSFSWHHKQPHNVDLYFVVHWNSVRHNTLKNLGSSNIHTQLQHKRFVMWFLFLHCACSLVSISIFSHFNNVYIRLLFVSIFVFCYSWL